MRRLRQHDADAYGLLARLGIAVPGQFYFNGESELNRRELIDAATRVSFGGCLIAKDRNIEAQGAFVYFQKVKRPSGVQSFAGDVYRLSVLVDNRSKERRWNADLVAILACHVGISPQGDMHLLREHVLEAKAIRPHKRGGHRGAFVRRSRHWVYPRWVAELAPSGKEPQLWATSMLAMALLTYRSAVSKIVIRVRKGDCVAAFGIELPRAKRFFSDRDAVLASDGRKKRIFHSVVEHDRELASLKTTRVRQHFRGLRDFVWNSYSVHIVLPARRAILDFNAPGRYEGDLKNANKWMTGKEAGAQIADALSA